MSQREVALSDRWSLERVSIYMKFSMTKKEKMTFKYRGLLNRGNHIGRFDCTSYIIRNGILMKQILHIWNKYCGKKTVVEISQFI